MSNVFDLFSPELKDIVSRRFKQPTTVQEGVIPEILKGKDILAISETGSGKTEACLLPVFDLWLKTRPKQVSILYITPLRSLNRNLFNRIEWWAKELDMDVSVRHGDTSSYERKLQAENPPDMLIVTPETLQSILVGSVMRKHLKNIRYILIDEVHELVQNKRGLQLSLALERLKYLIESSGNQKPQTICLSATVGTPEAVAKFFSLKKNHKIVNLVNPKKMSVIVEYPQPEERDYILSSKMAISPEIVARVRRICDLIKRRNSVLTFTNTREFSEILSSRIKAYEKEIPIETHHSSLSKYVRIKAEEGFRKGEIKSLICTSSLELGIDIGSIDFIVQYQSPRQVTKLLQRVGRSGHRYDKISEGIIISADPDDCFESVVIVDYAKKGKIEETRPYTQAWDVLAHQIVGISLDVYKISLNEAYNIVKRSWSYRNLSKDDFYDLCKLLEKLRYLWVDEKYSEEPILKRRRKAFDYYFNNLSTIPDVKNYVIYDVVSDKPVGSLDAEFVAMHGSSGSTFITKGQAWKILDVRNDRVYVEPVDNITAAIPAWEGELIPVPFEVAQGVGRLRREIQSSLESKKHLLSRILEKYCVTKDAADMMYKTIKGQYDWGFVPNDKEILIEYFMDGDDVWVVIHSCWGSLVNDTIGRVLSALLVSKLGSVGVQTDPYRIIIKLHERGDWDDVISSLKELKPENIPLILKLTLPNTELFAWRFLHVAKRFGIISNTADYGKGYIRKLIDIYAGTPVFQEAMNEVFFEKLDVEKAKDVIKRLKQGEIKLIIRKGLSPLGEMGIKGRYEIVASSRPEAEIFKAFKKRIMETRVGLVCFSKGDWAITCSVKDVPEEVKCPRCGARMVAVVPSRYVIEAQELVKKYRSGNKLSSTERKYIDWMSDSASITSSSGKKAAMALAGRGIGPRTAGRILSKMLEGDALLKEIMKAEQTYIRTKKFWKG